MRAQTKVVIKARDIEEGDTVVGFNTTVERVFTDEVGIYATAGKTLILFRSGYRWQVDSDENVAVLR